MRFLSSSPKATRHRLLPRTGRGHSLRPERRTTFVLLRARPCHAVACVLVGRLSAFGSNSARSAPKATEEIAICRQEVVPPGWIEQPTPGLGMMWQASSPVVSCARLCCTVQGFARRPCWVVLMRGCLLYTSDAADEEDSVDLGGRRI